MSIKGSQNIQITFSSTKNPTLYDKRRVFKNEQYDPHMPIFITLGTKLSYTVGNSFYFFFELALSASTSAYEVNPV